MKKEELMKKIEGLTDEAAEKVLEMFGGYIPKSRFDEVNEAKKNAEALVKERDGQIEALKKDNDGNEALKKQIAELQESNKKAVAEKEAEIKKIRIDNAVNNSLREAGAKNIKAVLPFLNLENVKFDEAGKLDGISEQIEALKKAEDSSFLFNVPNPNPKKSGVTPKIDNNPKVGTVTKEQFDKMGYKARLELYNSDKELYDSLSKSEE